jgi:hypothetical protein
MTTDQVSGLATGLGPTLVAAGSAGWIVFMYFSNQRAVRKEQVKQAEKDEKARQEARKQEAVQAERDNIARRFEAQKPFNELQLKLYRDVAKTAGELVTITDFASPEWQAALRRFQQLFWTELSMVEDERVKKAMEKFSQQLETILEADSTYGVSSDEVEALQQKAYRLAHALRDSIASTWSVELAKSKKMGRWKSRSSSLTRQRAGG